MKGDARTRFDAKTDRRGPNECWLWLGSKHRSGHGEFFISPERRKVSAHVFALELASGQPCPPGLEGCHTCDNPPCVNPAHIYFGTRQQNVDDMWRRGRGRRGSATAMARLTEAQVVEIRERFAAGESMGILSIEYGIRDSTLSNIVTGKNWKHAGGPVGVHGRPGRRPKRKVA